MKQLLIVVAALLFSASGSAGDCTLCRDQLKKALEACKAQPAGSARDLCRVDAQQKAKTCEGNKTCNLDQLIDPPKPEPAKAK